MFSHFRAKLQKHEKMIETVALVLAIAMFISLIEIFLSNLRGDSYIVIQPVLTAVNGLFWSLYAYAKEDWMLFTPNFLALLLGLLTAFSVVF